MNTTRQVIADLDKAIERIQLTHPLLSGEVLDEMMLIKVNVGKCESQPNGIFVIDLSRTKYFSHVRSMVEVYRKVIVPLVINEKLISLIRVRDLLRTECDTQELPAYEGKT